MIHWLVAGLGNPGRKYEGTRHNVGFLALELLAKRHQVKINRLKFDGLCGEITLPGGPGQAAVSALLLLPQTYMNESGRSLRRALDFYKLPPERALVAFDDASLPPGKLRLRSSGSDGGHNGIKSILYHLGSDQFPRVKIGVGAPPDPGWDLADWVLALPSASDAKLIGEALLRAGEAVEAVLRAGMDAAMNEFN